MAENLNKEREGGRDQEIKKKENSKFKKKMENLNKEREGRTDKVIKKKNEKRKKEIAKEFLSLPPCLSPF